MIVMGFKERPRYRGPLSQRGGGKDDPLTERIKQMKVGFLHGQGQRLPGWETQLLE